MTIKVARESRNPRDHQVCVGDLIRVIGWQRPGLVTDVGAGDTCPDYVIAVFSEWGETVVYADEWEVINA
jgi:hypothetical protein